MPSHILKLYSNGYVLAVANGHTILFESVSAYWEYIGND